MTITKGILFALLREIPDDARVLVTVRTAHYYRAVPLLDVITTRHLRDDIVAVELIGDHPDPAT
jgi:hypothetical protein